MFESDFLDFFTRVHPLVPLFLFGPAIGLLAVLGFAGAGVARARLGRSAATSSGR